MRLILGVLSLLVVVAVVGVLAKQQLQVGQTATQAAAYGSIQVPAVSGTPAEQSRQLQEKVRSDIGKALEQGAVRRDESAQ